MDLSEYILEPVHADEALALYRGRIPTASSDGSILLIRPVSEHPAPAALRRLGHEYSLAGELDSGWAARPVALTEHEGRTTLVLEDGGGKPLDALLGKPMQLGLFLRVAVGLAAALRELHARGIIHKDVKPANALVDTATGRVWLTGFGIASRLRRERQAPEPPEVIAGTLPYMAPEQTGRMNRSIDSRADLYSLGVTFYQMLTGVLPFTAADPMEWVHSHIARKPVPPAQRVPDVPAAISAIVLRLLAKTAEDRYQTALGVERDLRRCLAEWEAHGRIDDFPPGGEDTPDLLLIPEKLYGRKREIEILLEAFDRVVAEGRPELVLVSGYSGIGKSSVVHELHKSLVPPRGLFASGKFEQFKRDVPYSTLAQAFQGLVRQLLGKPESELGGWRDALREALGENGQLMVDLVPELKVVIGEQPKITELPPQRAQCRFQLVFRRFIGVFARREHPLALFLDDLQWLDGATLDLIEDLVTQREVQYLTLIGAYRDNEVDSSHPLMRKVVAIRGAGAAVHEIVLGPLARDDLGRLIADAIRSEPRSVADLAQLVADKTGGNPFFAIQFLSTLAEEKLLAFAHGTARWSWDLERIHAKRYTDNVVDLMIRKLGRLPSETQTAVRTLACLGHIAPAAMLARVQGTTEDQVHGDLWEAVRHELIERFDGSYRFMHDRIQEAAYSLVPAEARPGEHLRIGRLLLLHTLPERREENIFDIVNQLNRGAGLIDSREERERLAELDLIAGKRARASSAYGAALNHLVAGAELLADDRWERCHELAFALELGRAECEFLTGALRAAEKRLSDLSTVAAGTAEEALVACLRIDLFSALDRSDRAVEIGADYLRGRGIDWPQHPTEAEVKREYQRIWSLLGSRTIEELVDLPPMTDEESLPTIDVLIRVGPPSLFTDKNLHALAACKVITLSLEKGNSDGSCYGYTWVASIAGREFDDYEAALRFGQLGYELVERRGLKRFQPATCFVFGGIILPWKKHFRACRDLIRRSFTAANEIGDLSFAVYASSVLVSSLITSGDPLGEAQREAELNREFARKARFGFMADTATAHLGLIRTLRGLTRAFGRFDEGEFEEAQFERHLSSTKGQALAECWWWIRKLQARFLAGDTAAALEAAARAEKLIGSQPTILAKSDYAFFAALAHAASCGPGGAEERGPHLEAIASHRRQLEMWARKCPENFAHRAALVGAETARLEGRPLEAMDLYERALGAAKANGFVHDEGLANELAARFHADRGLGSIAQSCLREARYCYLRWGADGKVRQLEQAHPHLREDAKPSGQASTIGAPVEQLDLATVVKVSEAVSGDLVLERVIEALLRTAIEHAGAERGLLIVPREGELSIEAEAITDGIGVEFRLREEPVSSSDLAESVVRYAARTQESVIVGDASTPGPFSADEYIARAQIRSVLCLPMVKQGRLVALLYLENSLTRDVFTPARTAVLRVLAAQASMALENGRLYRDLQQRESKIRRLVDANIVGVMITRVDGKVIEANDAFLDMLGFTRDDLASGLINWRQLTPPEWQPATERIAEKAFIAGGTADVYEKEYFRKDGSRVPVLVAGAALEDNPVQAVAFVVDLTERKRAEAERATFRGWVESYPGLMVTMTPSGEVDLFSREVLGYFGKTREELRNWSLGDAVHPDDLPRVVATWMACIPNGLDYTVEHRCRRADGVYRWFLVRAIAVRDKDSRVTGWFVVLTDIDDIKRAQEVIRASERSLALTIDTIPGLVWSASSAGADFLNQHYLDFVGLTESQGLTSDWTCAVHPDDRPGLIADWQRVMASGLPGESEARLRRYDGEYRWFLFRANPLRDETGKIVKWYGINTDIQDRKQAEADRRAKEVAEMANRAKDQFMANVSHEIRTPMNAILGMTELALEQSAEPEQRHSLSTVKSAAEKLLVIIDDLLDFAKIEAGKVALALAPMSIRAVVYDTLGALAVRAHAKGVELVADVDAGVPDAVTGDAGRLRQILLNLVGNAIKFTAQGEIVVRVELDPATDAGSPLSRFTVRDTGIGIPPDKLEVIFQAFEQADPSTARRYGGTGLGLSIARRLVALMGGAMSVSSEVGVGSAFTFTASLLPGEQEAVDPAPLAGLRGLPALIVEPNATSRVVLERLVTGWGMVPAAVAGGAAALPALRTAAAAGRPYAIALVDLRSAQMDGSELPERIRDDPALAGTRIVLLQHTDRSGAKTPAEARVQKPVRPEELLEAVRAALGLGKAGSALLPPSPRSPTRTLRVLVAEDDELNQRLMRMLLGKRGHVVTVARTGREALALFDAQEFDVALLDLHLPEMDGLEVIGEIRRRERATGRHLRTIALTARSRPEDREASLAAGMDEFLTKPISAAKLWAALQDDLPRAPAADVT